MQRNLVFVRAGDASLHRTWLVPRAERTYDIFISYGGAKRGKFQDDGEFYEAASGPKYHVFGRFLRKKRELVSSYSAIWTPDDDILTSAALINRMFEVFAKYQLLLAQPALAPGSDAPCPVTEIIDGKVLHFSQFVGMTSPIFACSILKTLAPTFFLNRSGSGICLLWPYLLGYPPKRVAILDETPVLDTCHEEQQTWVQADYERIVKRYHIDHATTFSRISRVFGSIGRLSKPRKRLLGRTESLVSIQRRIDRAYKYPIFYEYRVKRINRGEPLNAGGTSPGPSNEVTQRKIDRRTAANLKKLVSSRDRLESIAKDFVRHWEARKEVREGKAMLVCMDQQICYALQKSLEQLRPEWKQGKIKVLIAAKKLAKSQEKPCVVNASGQSLVERFRNPQDPLEVVITNSIWPDDFDCPLLNTIYVDVPIPLDRHMDAVGRLMRAFRNRRGTLVVDYFGVARLAQAVIGTSMTVRGLLGASGQQHGQQHGQRALQDGRLERTTQGPISRQRRIAHLFLIRNNLNHEEIWANYFKGHESKYNIYVHAKWPEQMTSELLRDRHIPKRCDTNYAEASLVKAELLLLEQAFKNRENCFFLLHSESCVPIRSFEYVYRHLFNKGRSWLRYYRGNMKRYYSVEMSAIPLKHFFTASQWFCLTRDHVATLLSKGTLKNWRHSIVPDEYFIPSTLAMSGKLQECLPQPLTFADWDVQRKETPGGPATFHKLLPGDVEALLRTKALFARKFAPDSDISRYIELLHGKLAGRTDCAF